MAEDLLGIPFSRWKTGLIAKPTRSSFNGLRSLNTIKLIVSSYQFHITGNIDWSHNLGDQIAGHGYVKRVSKTCHNTITDHFAESIKWAYKFTNIVWIRYSNRKIRKWACFEQLTALLILSLDTNIQILEAGKFQIPFLGQNVLILYQRHNGDEVILHLVRTKIISCFFDHETSVIASCPQQTRAFHITCKETKGFYPCYHELDY